MNNQRFDFDSYPNQRDANQGDNHSRDVYPRDGYGKNSYSNGRDKYDTKITAMGSDGAVIGPGYGQVPATSKVNDRGFTLANAKTIAWKAAEYAKQTAKSNATINSYV